METIITVSVEVILGYIGLHRACTGIMKRKWKRLHYYSRVNETTAGCSAAG